jgi:hypothetical protein
VVRFSYFSGFYSDVAESCEVESWNDFVECNRKLSNVEGTKSPEHWLISSGIYGDNKTRCNDNVIGWDIVMMDIDDGITNLDDICNKFSGYNYIIYSSPSCTYDKLKLRIIIPLHQFAKSEVLSQIWHGCNMWCGDIIDPQTKDKSRMMYPPMRYTNKGDEYRHIFITNKGNDLDWEKLILEYPSPKESDRFKNINKLSGLKRKIYLQSKAVPVMDIRNRECPFVYKKMIEDYLLTPAGQHHKAIYTFMVKVCYNAEKISYPISIDELVDMAKQLDDMDGSHYNDKKLYNSAKDALEYTGV